MTTITKSNLLPALSLLGRVADRSKAQAVLFSKRAGTDKFSVMAHDSYLSPSLSASYTVDSSGSTDRPVEFAVDLFKLRAFVNVCSGDITFRQTDKNCMVESGTNKARFPLLSTQYFPDIKMPEDPIVSLSLTEARNLLTISSIPKKDAPNVIASGVYVMFHNDYVRAIATDGNRAGYTWAKRTCAVQKHYFLHGNILNILSESYWDDESEDALTISTSGENHIIFENSNFFVAAPQIHLTSPYPYSDLINMMGDEGVGEFSIDPIVLRDHIRALYALHSGEGFLPIDMKLDEAGLHMAVNREIGGMNFTVPATRVGVGEFDVTANASYVNDAIRTIEILSMDGFQNLRIYQGKSTSWIYVKNPNISAVFVLARMAKNE